MGQSGRLTSQHKESHGVEGIFTAEAKTHDASVRRVAVSVLGYLKGKYPQLSFRHRTSISKAEINSALQKIDRELGQTLFVSDASIQPDGGIIEVKDDNGNCRVILVSEAKYQGRDIENISRGVLVGKKRNQDLMVTGNAIERAHKNISEIANYMLDESHFPYLFFLEGSNFMTQDITIRRPDGRTVTLNYNSGALNRLDRLTSANYGMPINTNLCRNKFIQHRGSTIMLQAASIYTHGDGREWEEQEMFRIMSDIAATSLQVLGSDLFIQLTGK
ncbi:MAG: hypothetical protein II877_03875 [Synergistaceae bacterium]|nr:hypothetical protein [Synergistaceae bacterium]MBQ4430620.1 hypothetical protein [Synergistaceae bacterium]